MIARYRVLHVLLEYLKFRHVFRNVYTFELQHDRIAALVQGLRPCFENCRDDFLAFATFLDGLATADES